VGRDSSVGIATRYGLDGPGSNLGEGEIFHTRPDRHPASYKMDTGSFPGIKRPERGVDHPQHLAQRLKKEYSYTSSTPLGFRGLF
jgi:hypothetical protein